MREREKRIIELEDIGRKIIFIAVKIGDVNGTATANALDGTTDTRSTVELNAQNEIVNADKRLLYTSFL